LIIKGENNINSSVVYSVGFKTNLDQINSNKFYYTDHFKDINLDNFDLLVIKCLDSMIVPKYNKFIFYVPNMGGYDSVFILKILLKYNEINGETYLIEPFYRDNRMLKLTLRNKNNLKVKIMLVDSYNLLSNSLDKLAKDLDVDTLKGIFPYLFPNLFNLDYVGPMPEISYYNSNVTTKLYDSLYQEKWSLRDETLKYLDKDLSALLEILNEFQDDLFINHNLELTSSLTISNLALTKFLKYYLNESKLPLITKSSIYEFCANAYYGGRTEVFNPYGENFNFLDVNSLYPFAALNPMPGTECIWLESYNDKGLNLDQLFGFFYAEVVTNNQYFGLLPLQTKEGLIFPRCAR